MRRRRTLGLAALGWRPPWRWPPAAAAAPAAAGEAAGSTSAGFNAAITNVGQPVHGQGRDPQFRQQQRAGLDRPGQHLLRVHVELHPAVHDAADDLQVLPPACRPAGRPGPGHRPRRRQRQRPDLDLPHPAGRQVRGRHRGHLRRRQVRGRAHLRPRPVPARARLLPVPAGRERRDLSRAVQGPGQEPDGPDRGRHAERDHDRVPPREAVRGLQLRGRDPADRSGAAGQGHRRELPAAPDLHRPVHVPELPAEQAAHAGAEPVLEGVDRPEGQPAGQQDHDDDEHERERHRQPAAGR